MKKKVSIIIPTYKRSDMLERAIESCLKQTYDNIEIIVIDDNNPGTDFRVQTEMFMEKYKDNDKIKYFKMERNGGGAAARNYGIKKSKGTYIAFLDDDDEFLPDKIKLQLKFMIKHNLDASFSNKLVYGENNKLLFKKTYEDFDRNRILPYHLTKLIVGTQTFMYKKKVLEEINGFDIVPAGQEFVLMYKTIIKGYKVDYLNASLVKIYIHQGDRISTGKKKIDGERLLYSTKKKHFNLLTTMEKKEVKFTWRINLFRIYRRSKSYKYLIVLFIIIILHPYRFYRTFILK